MDYFINPSLVFNPDKINSDEGRVVDVADWHFHQLDNFYDEAPTFTKASLGSEKVLMTPITKCQSVCCKSRILFIRFCNYVSIRKINRSYVRSPDVRGVIKIAGPAECLLPVFGCGSDAYIYVKPLRSSQWGRDIAQWHYHHTCRRLFSLIKKNRLKMSS